MVEDIYAVVSNLYTLTGDFCSFTVQDLKNAFFANIWTQSLRNCLPLNMRSWKLKQEAILLDGPSSRL